MTSDARLRSRLLALERGGSRRRCAPRASRRGQARKSRAELYWSWRASANADSRRAALALEARGYRDSSCHAACPGVGTGRRDGEFTRFWASVLRRTRRGATWLTVGTNERRHEVSLAERIAVGEVEAVAHTLLEAIRRRHGTLVIPGRPRAIDRHIDYFGGRVDRPATWSGATSDRRDIAIPSGPPRTAECRLCGTAREVARGR